MHRYVRHRVDLGYSDLFGTEVRVVGDYDWVEQAVSEAWFSISKTRGTWQVYLPYTIIFDVPGREGCQENTFRFYQTAEQAFQEMQVPYSIRENSNGLYLEYYKARFRSWKHAEQFAMWMQLKGCTYVPAKRVRTGFE